MLCHVYKSEVKAEHFLYLPQALEAAELPEPLLALLGDMSKVLEFDLQPERELPNADSAAVLAQLNERGYYLQLPSEQDLDELLANINLS